MVDDRAQWLALLPRKVVGAGAVITDDDGRVLLVKPTNKPKWELPGGCVESGESAREACARELEEELGVPRPVGRLLVLEHQTVPDDKGDASMLLYDGGSLGSAITLSLPADELSDARFVTVDEAESLLPEGLSRRLRAAMRARGDGAVIEVTNGEADGLGRID